MRKIYPLFISFFFIINIASSQTRIFDESRNIYNDNSVQQIRNGNAAISNASSADINCGVGGKFWTVTAVTGTILEWQLSDTTITFLDTLFTLSPIESLSYCNLLNAGSISTTLYGSEITTVSWYNGTSWVTITPQQEYTNSGGCGRFLYFMRSGAMALDRYNGSTFTNVITLQNAQFTIADLAVDTGGKIWSMVSKVSIGDTLAAFDSSGNVVKKYAISPGIDEDNAYGCFLMDSTLYIGIGNANTTYPNTVIPIRIYADTAIEGNPLPFVNGDFDDMASCTDALILGIQNYMNSHLFMLYPNPARDQLTIQASSDWSSATISIFNMLGQNMLSNSLSLGEGRGEAIDINKLPAGIYFVNLSSEKENWAGKFVKQ